MSVPVHDPSQDIPILRMAKVIQNKFRTITENNEEIQKMKLLNKKISPEEEKKLAEDLSQILV